MCARGLYVELDAVDSAHLLIASHILSSGNARSFATSYHRFRYLWPDDAGTSFYGYWDTHTHMNRMLL